MMNPERGGHVPQEAERQDPFKEELEKIGEGKDFDAHKLGAPESEVQLPGGEGKDFDRPDYAVTEYHDAGGKSHEQFARLKAFYEAASEELGPFLPKAMFVEGHPSAGGEGRSFFVVQKFDKSMDGAKSLNELNAQEFSVEFMDQLLDIQQRLRTFLENHAQDMPEGWVEAGFLDDKSFKEDVIHSPAEFKTQITNMFRLNPDFAKKAAGSTAGFEPSADVPRAIKMLGLGKLVEKIQWAMERSGAPEWVAGKDIRWQLNPNKMRRLEEEGRKAMAISFDDGPNDETERLLDILKEKGVKATFFLVGSQIAGREHIVRRMAEEGHEIGNHEWTQEGEKSPLNTKEYMKRFVGPRRDLGDVTANTELIAQVTGRRPTIGRMSGVHGTVDSLREFQAAGLTAVHAHWYDVAFIPPTETLPAEKLLRRAMSANGHGRIRLFHIGKMTDKGVPLLRSEVDFSKGHVYAPEETLKMIGEYIDRTRAQGYEFVGIEENI